MATRPNAIRFLVVPPRRNQVLERSEASAGKGRNLGWVSNRWRKPTVIKRIVERIAINGEAPMMRAEDGTAAESGYPYPHPGP